MKRGTWTEGVWQKSAEETVWTEGTGGRTLHNEELHNVNFSPSKIRMIKSRRVRWAGNLVHMGRRRMRIGYWWESQENRDH
jgi:hypothetical protein